MKIRLLHKNLDTAFVDLTALLRYLRQQKFVGMVRVENPKSYKAEVIFDEAHRVKMREFERGFDGMVESETGLQRLIAQCKAPGTMISVFEAIDYKKPALEEEKSEILDLTEFRPDSRNNQVNQTPIAPPAPKIPKPVEKIFMSGYENGVKNGNGNGNGHARNGSFQDTSAALFINGADVLNDPTPEPVHDSGDIFPIYSHPVEIVEEKQEAKTPALSPAEWEELIATTAALLGTIDSILRAANLGFPDAFTKSRVEISNEYPFLHPLKGVLHYEDGRVTLNEEVEPALLVSGVSECLRRILNKLISNPKFFAVYKRITQQVLILVRQRQSQFDKFGYTKQLERIIKF